jgi:hypothetical protein
MMNRFETSVRSIIACLMVAMVAMTLPMSAYAEEEGRSTNNNGSRDCSSEKNDVNKYKEQYYAEQDKDGGGDAETLKRLKSRWDEADRDLQRCYGTNTNDNGDCSQAENNYKEARSKFAGACSNLAPGYKPSEGWPLCSKQVEQCNVCPMTNSASAERRNELECSNISNAEEEDAPANAPSGAFAMRDVKTGEALLQYCPGKLGAEQKDLEKQFADSQKEVKRLEAELPKKQAEYSSIMAKNEEAMVGIQEKMTAAQNELDNQMTELQNAQSDAEQAATQKIQQLEEQIRRADDSIRQVELSKADIENTYTEAIKQIHLNCHASAVANVSKMQQDRLQLERANQFNQVSFNNMMKSVGVSDREQWQRVATKYYNWCLQSKPTKDSENSALKIRDSALAKAAEAITKLEGDKGSLRAQIKSVKDDHGCAQAGKEPTEMCRAMQKFQRQAEAYQRQYNSKMNQANAEMGAKQRAGQAEAQAKMAEAQVIQQQLNEERVRLDNLKRYLELAYQAGGGMTSGDAKYYVEAREKHGEFVGAAGILVSCNYETDCQSGPCKEAYDFLVNLQGTPPQFKDGGKPPESETPRTNDTNTDGVEAVPDSPATGVREDDDQPFTIVPGD